MTRWLCVMLVVGLLAPASAAAHSALRDAVPEPGGVLPAAPHAVTLTFTEGVDPRLAVVRVRDARGHPIELAKPVGAGPGSLRAALREALPNGGYTVFYRVISEDGHQTTGGFGFAVGPHAVVPRVAAVPSLGGSGPGGIGATAARALRDGGVALAAGAALFALLAGAGAVRGLVVIGGWAAILGALSGVWLLAPGSAGFHTRFGTASALVAVLAAVLIVVAPRGTDRPAPAETARRPDALAPPAEGGVAVLAPSVAIPAAAVAAAGVSRARGAVVVAVAAALAVALVAAGHAASRPDSALLVAVSAVHVLAASMWVGGVASLLVTATTARAALRPALTRFAPVALGSVAVLAATGVISAVVDLGSPRALVQTAFGRTIVLKTGVLFVVVGLAADHRRVRPAGATRRTLRLEAVGLGTALVLAAALAGYPPPGAAAAGPAAVTLTFEQAQVRGTLTPARAGRNTLRFVLTRRGDAVAYSEFARLRITATQGATTERLTAAARSDGTYALALTLPRTGDWRLAMTLDVDRFNVFTREHTVTIR